MAGSSSCAPSRESNRSEGNDPVGFTPPHVLREYIRAVKAATPSPFNVNCITCFDNDAQVMPAQAKGWRTPKRCVKRVPIDGMVGTGIS
jgi:hypothetical protein